MPTYTTNYNLAKPLVNSAVDQDLWGYELNDDLDIIDSTMKTISDAVPTTAEVAALVYPVGSIYMNASVSTNPATLFGFGTWTAITDRFIIGAGGSYPAGSTGGSTTHTLTANEIPTITSKLVSNLGTNVFVADNATGSSVLGANISVPGLNTKAQITVTSTNTGGASHSILNPYYGAYVWRRTA